MPIDIPAIAAELNSDADTVFGRLYYHLDPQYEQVNANGSWKHLFRTQECSRRASTGVELSASTGH